MAKGWLSRCPRHRDRRGKAMTHTPETRGALVDRLLALANAEVESPAPHMTGDMKFYVYESQLRDLLKEAAAALARQADVPELPAGADWEARYKYALVLIDAADEDEGGMAGVAFSAQAFHLIDGKSPSQIAAMLCEDATRPDREQSERTINDEINEDYARAADAASPTPPAPDTAASVQQGEG
jgi:hypothetical protein